MSRLAALAAVLALSMPARGGGDDERAGGVVHIPGPSFETNRDASGAWRGTRDIAPELEEARAPEEPRRDDPPQMTLADAKMNFATVVETFLLTRSVAGVWTYADLASGKTLRLTRPKIQPNTIAQGRDKRYRGLVLMRDLASRRAVPMRFTVDFSAADWKVDDFALEPEDEPAPRPTKAARRRGK